MATLLCNSGNYLLQQIKQCLIDVRVFDVLAEFDLMLVAHRCLPVMQEKCANWHELTMKCDDIHKIIAYLHHP